MIGLLRRWLSQARGRRVRAGSAADAQGKDERREAGPRIEAARQRLKQTIPPPEDQAPAEDQAPE